jgi:uncharacterized surface protein with fasciclin (FAS1) repeats
MSFRKSLAVTVAAAAIALSAGAAQAQNCMEVLSRTPQASQFVNALVRTGQTALLRGAGPFTILAPTNEAVNRLPIQFRNDVFGTAQTSIEEMDPVLAPAVVNAHLIDGRHVAAEVVGQQQVTMTTRNGNELLITRGADGRYTLVPQGRGRRAPEGHVVQADIPCSNGVIHLVDAVLVRR